MKQTHSMWKLFFALLVFTAATIVCAEKTKWTDKDTNSYWIKEGLSEERTSTEPRYSGADKERGEGMLETFGTRYLPNAYANYQKARETAKEREQILAENFPNGRPSNQEECALYDKVKKTLTKAISEMFRRHDELCHFYLLQKTGAITESELVEMDAKPINIMLPPESENQPDPYSDEIEDIPSSERDFAIKYLPGVFEERDRLQTLFNHDVKLYEDILSDIVVLDATRGDFILDLIRVRLDIFRETIEEINKLIKEKRLAHAVDEVTLSELANIDQESCKILRPARKKFEENGKESLRALICYGARYLIDCVKAQCLIKQKIVKNMVAIPNPNMDYMMGKFEVSQKEWETIMGDNPAEFKGENNPVENISWNECQEFLQRLNGVFDLEESGLWFRLPTWDEWRLAATEGKDKKLTQKEFSKLDQVAWYMANSGKKTHPVGEKAPNAFGLYDIYGNVWELTAGDGNRFGRGGNAFSDAEECAWGMTRLLKRDEKMKGLGIRLCASGIWKNPKPERTDSNGKAKIKTKTKENDPFGWEE